MKDGEGINQRTFMHSLWTPTMICGLTEGGKRAGLSGGRKRGKSGNCNIIDNKFFKCWQILNSCCPPPSQPLLLALKVSKTIGGSIEYNYSNWSSDTDVFLFPSDLDNKIFIFLELYLSTFFLPQYTQGR